jgi:hypothetical protein
MKSDAPLKLTHEVENKWVAEEPYKNKKAVEQPDTVLVGVVHDDDGNHPDEDEEETV